MLQRRKFLKNSGTIASGLILSSGIGSAGIDKKRVPKYMRGDEVMEWMKVPRDWLAQHDAAKKALKGLTQSYRSKPGVVETGLSRAEETYGGKNGFQIEVGIHSDSFVDTLPDAVDGIPVVQTEKDPEEPGLVCFNQSDYSNMKGGVYMADEALGQNGNGTSGYRVKYDGSYHMLTASHLFDQGTCSYSNSDDAYQVSDKIGGLVAGSEGYDYAIAANDAGTSISFENKIKGESTTYPISGYMSEEEVANRVSDWFDGYRKMGVSSGETTGGLGGKNITMTNNGCYDLNGEGVRGSASSVEGDSGGPAFSVESGDALLAYHISAGDGDRSGTYNNCAGEYLYNKSVGTPAYGTVQISRSGT